METRECLPRTFTGALVAPPRVAGRSYIPLRRGEIERSAGIYGDRALQLVAEFA